MKSSAQSSHGTCRGEFITHCHIIVRQPWLSSIRAPTRGHCADVFAEGFYEYHILEKNLKSRCPLIHKYTCKKKL